MGNHAQSIRQKAVSYLSVICMNIFNVKYYLVMKLRPSFEGYILDIDGFVQDFGNSSMLAMELQQSSNKSNVYLHFIRSDTLMVVLTGLHW